jgi:hypothetical protein
LVHKPYAILAGLQLLDVGSTAWVLHHFEGAAERNPVTSALFTGFGLDLGLLLLLLLKVGVVALFWDCQTKVRLATAIYGLVIFNNALFGALYLWSTWR